MIKESELGWAPEEQTAVGVARAVNQAIREGVLPPGTKLPPIRSVARQLQLSPTTINAAWNLLARSGTIRTDGRRGSRVTDNHINASRYKRALDGTRLFSLDLSTGVPAADLLPDLAPALGNLKTTAVPAGYLEAPIIPELVAVLRRGWPCAAPDFTIVDGAMDGLELATRTLIRFGDRVVVEDPVLPLLLDQLDAAGAEIIGIPIDDQGMTVAPLAEALKKPVAAIFLQPRAQNPTGVALTPARASELANIIGATKAVVIEDDSAGSVASTAAISLGQWLPEQTLHIRSFSKSHGPDLRLAAMSGPAHIMHALAALRQHGQGWSSRLLQRILYNLLTTPAAVAQIEHARDEYKSRRHAFVTALQTHDISVIGSDGFNVWVPVADETAALVRLASQGIGAAAGAPFMVNDNPQPHIRVTIGAVADDHARLADTIAAAAYADGRRRGR